MKVAVIGSRSLMISNLQDYLPEETSALISGGAKGVDGCARVYAVANNIPLIEFLPEYNKYGRAAPLHRNKQIIDHADLILAFWDGQSRGTKFSITYCQKLNKPLRIIQIQT